MRALIGSVCRPAAAIAALCLASGTAIAADQTIADFEVAQQAAWNAHDATAYAAAFDQSAVIITSAGWRWTGGAEAARNLGAGFRLVYAKARLEVTDVQVRALTPELASVTLDWSIDGARTISGAPQVGQQRGFETQLLERRGASWTILSQQDTLAAAPPPTPAQSPAGSVPPPAAQTFLTTPPPVRRCIVARTNGECVIYGKPKPAPAD